MSKYNEKMEQCSVDKTCSGLNKEKIRFSIFAFFIGIYMIWSSVVMFFVGGVTCKIDRLHIRGI